MDPNEEIAQQIGHYLQQGALSQHEFAAQHAPELEQAHREVTAMATQPPANEAATRGLSEVATGVAQSATGLAGWIWHQVEPVVKQQICSPQNYQQLKSITVDQLSAHVDDVLQPLTASITGRLPPVLKFLVPILGILRRLIANIVAAELQHAAQMGWAQYCGIPAG
jgi:hypothetical protein